MMEAMTDYESLKFMLLLPFTIEGGDTADYSLDEIQAVLRFAQKIDARAAAAEATIAAIRTALGGYPDSDLVSLATTLNARNKALEVANENMREALEHIAEMALHPDLADPLETMVLIACAVLAEVGEDGDE